ncbi:MAG: peptidylprolyl isomerase [Parcubacteria group bacterium]|nr:peptidylprolyl isomerase [Parcubacteria group bacterium]
MHTNKGDITLKFYARHAPKTVENFLKLARGGFYDGVKFHRVINDFMIQTGDPNSKDDDWKDDGQGGPGYTIDDEFNNIKFLRSIVAMAKTALPNSGGSQFFIVTNKHAEWLNGQYTAFAVVTEGMDVVNAIEKVKTTDKYDLPPDHPVEDIVIERVEVRE